jgi:hypothetical protein
MQVKHLFSLILWRGLNFCVIALQHCETLHYYLSAEMIEALISINMVGQLVCVIGLVI